jgi:hypothetical protein
VSFIYALPVLAERDPEQANVSVVSNQLKSADKSKISKHFELAHRLR